MKGVWGDAMTHVGNRPSSVATAFSKATGRQGGAGGKRQGRGAASWAAESKRMPDPLSTVNGPAPSPGVFAGQPEPSTWITYPTGPFVGDCRVMCAAASARPVPTTKLRPTNNVASNTKRVCRRRPPCMNAFLVR